jgi:hypothetical protein
VGLNIEDLHRKWRGKTEVGWKIRNVPVGAACRLNVRDENKGLSHLFPACIDYIRDRRSFDERTVGQCFALRIRHITKERSRNVIFNGSFDEDCSIKLQAVISSTYVQMLRI